MNQDSNHNAHWETKRSNTIILIASSVFLICLFTYLAYYRILNFYFTGPDAFPIIISSKIENLSDFIGSFTEKLMDGHVPSRGFYRPVSNIYFATLYGICKLDPFGYHLSGLSIHVLNSILIYILGVLILKRYLMPLIPALIFSLHPIQFETVPVIPRHPELLCSFFILSSLILASLFLARKNKFYLIASVVFTLFATGSKETGMVILVVLPLFLVIFNNDTLPNVYGYFKNYILYTILYSIPCLIYFSLRLFVIGGIGGRHVIKSIEIFTIFKNNIITSITLISYLKHIDYFTAMLSNIGFIPLALTVFFSFILALIYKNPAYNEYWKNNLREKKLLIFSLACYILILMLYSFSRTFQIWYLYILIIPFSYYFCLIGKIACKLLFHMINNLLKTFNAIDLRLAWQFSNKANILSLIYQIFSFSLFIVIFSFSLYRIISFSPLLYKYKAWSSVSDMSKSYIAQLDKNIQALTPGDESPLPKYFIGRIMYNSNSSYIVSAFFLNEYSIKAYLDLVYKGKVVLAKSQSGLLIHRRK